MDQLGSEIDSLRTRILAEHNLEYGRFIRARHSQFLPLIIIIDDYLRRKYGLLNKTTRQMRLDMVAYWIGEPIRSFYDLTVYQCSTIINFLHGKEQETACGGADQILDFTQDAIKGSNSSSTSADESSDWLEYPDF